MSDEKTIPSDVAFTAAVKAVQQRKGSRKSYARMEKAGGMAGQDGGAGHSRFLLCAGAVSAARGSWTRPAAAPEAS